MRILRLSAAAEDAVLTALEDAVQDLHEGALRRRATAADVEEAEREIPILVRVIEQIDDEHPFLETPPRVGKAYDFDAVLDAYHGADEDDGDEEADDDDDEDDDQADDDGDEPEHGPDARGDAPGGARAPDSAPIDVEVVKP